MIKAQSVNKGLFEIFEKRIIFVISRIFFWILCIIAGAELFIALILLFYNIIPPIKENVPEPVFPPEVTISLADIQTAITPPPPKEERPAVVAKALETTPKKETKPEPPDPLQLALNEKIDTLKSYFPSDKYNWTTVTGEVVVGYDWWGDPIKEKRIIKAGLDRHLNKVLNLYDDKKKKIEIVEEIISIIAQIPEEKRGKALEAYANIRVKRENERKREIEEIQSDYESKVRMAERRYQEAKMSKAKGLGKSLGMLGGGFIGIAIIGLFLCFLAIERNTRTLQALLEKEK